MWRSELTREGGVKATVAGSEAVICARFCPALNPFTNAVLEALATDCALPATLGAIGMKVDALVPPGTTKVFFKGELVSNRVAVSPGKTSAKMPMPPRITVLPWPSGCHAKPKRGSQARDWYPGRAWCNPV